MAGKRHAKCVHVTKIVTKSTQQSTHKAHTFYTQCALTRRILDTQAGQRTGSNDHAAYPTVNGRRYSNTTSRLQNMIRDTFDDLDEARKIQTYTRYIG